MRRRSGKKHREEYNACIKLIKFAINKYCLWQRRVIRDLHLDASRQIKAFRSVDSSNR